MEYLSAIRVQDKHTVQRTYPYPTLTVNLQGLAGSTEQILHLHIIHEILRRQKLLIFQRISKESLRSGCPNNVILIYPELIDHLIFFQILIFQRMDAAILIQNTYATMKACPNAMMRIFLELSYDIVVDIFLRNTTLHKMVSCQTIPHIKSPLKGSYPNTIPAIHYTADEISAFHRQRLQLHLRHQELIHILRSHGQSFSSLSVIEANTAIRQAKLLIGDVRETLHIGIIKEYTMVCHSNHQITIPVSNRLHTISYNISVHHLIF